MLKDLKELPKITDSISYIYIEAGRIVQDSFSIKIIKESGEISLPVTNFCVLFLGPGTSITHQAVKICAESGVLIIWCGENLNSFYASGNGETRSGKNLMRQVEYFSNEEKHINVVRKMYQLRFPKIDMINMSIEQMRGIEGTRVRSFYKECSKVYNVPWVGRSYDKNNIKSGDLVNQCITYGDQLLYAICHAIIITMGFSPTIGFIHINNIRSFVFDIADLYKSEFVIPIAFKVASYNSGNSEGLMRREFHKQVGEKKLLKKIVTDLEYLFGEEIKEELIEGNLWTENGEIEFGKNYGE